MKKNEKGFSLVEVLVVLVVVGLLALAGWFVWNKQRNENPHTADTSKTAEVSKPSTDTKYLNISEWGIRLPLANDLQGATYKLSTDSGGQSINITLPNSLCDPMATIVRGSATDNDPTTNPDGQGSYKTYAQSKNSKQVGTLYYSLILGNGSTCFKNEEMGKDPAVGVKTTSVRTQLEAAFKNLSLL